MQVPVEAAHTPIGMLRSFLRLHSVRNWTQLLCLGIPSVLQAASRWRMPDVSNGSDGVREA